jgi:hypothetical protein
LFPLFSSTTSPQANSGLSGLAPTIFHEPSASPKGLLTKPPLES